MATDENTKNGEQDRNIPSEHLIPGFPKKSKRGWVLVGCSIACLCIAPNSIGVYLSAVILLTIFLDKHATISDAVRKRNKTHPETSLESVSRKTREERNIGCMPVVWGFLFGIIAGIVFASRQF